MRPKCLDSRYGGRAAGAIVVSLLLSALMVVFVEADLAAVLCAGVGLVTGLFLLGVAVASRGARLLSILALAGYLSVQLVLFTHYLSIRDHLRWALLSRAYEARVLAQHTPANGEFRHVAWDGWGYGGQETTVFLVLDPTNSLAALVGARPPVRARGLPCSVAHVRRLQSRWYAVKFYTDVDWEQGGCR